MFEIRTTERELLDAIDCDPQLASRSYRFMRLVNRLAGGTRAVKGFMAREFSRCDPGRPIRILDIGSGSCDIPLAIVKWAQGQSRIIYFTCIETNKTALELARDNIRRSGCNSIELRREDIFQFEPSEPFDYAVGSMVFHHFRDEQILRVIERLRSFVSNGVLINDLRRTSLTYLGCLLLVCPLSRGVQHDALLSVRKGFHPHELQRLLEQVENAHTCVQVHNLSRLTAVVRFNREGR